MTSDFHADEVNKQDKKKSYLFINSVCNCPIQYVCMGKVCEPTFSVTGATPFLQQKQLQLLYFGSFPCMNCLLQVLPKHFCRIKVMTFTSISNKFFVHL